MALSIQLDNVKEYIKQKIREVDPNIDTRDGSGVGDLLIKPLDAILQPIADEIIRISENQSLLAGAALTEPDLDALIANIFVTRNPGASARGTVRVFFADPITVTIPEGSEFLSAEELRFFSLSEVTITASQMSINKDGDFFFVDTLVEAEDVGSGGNVAAGDVVDFPGGPSNVLKVENLAAFTGGFDKEENAALIERTKEAITVRDLVSKPAIKTVLRQEFPLIRDIRVIGFGDPEMERDFLVGDNMELGIFPPIDVLDSTTGIHIGGKVDIYSRVVTLVDTVVRIDNLQANVILRPEDDFDTAGGPVPPNTQFVSTMIRPLIDIISLQKVDPVTENPIGPALIEGIDFTFGVDNRTVRFSTKERNRLTILNGLALGSTFLLTFKHSTDIVDIQNFVDLEDNRVVTADLLAKFTTPAVVDFSLSVKLESGSTNTAADLEALIITFINALTVGARLEASDIVKLMYDNGVEFVELPFTMTVTVSKSDGTEDVLVSDSVIEIPATAGYLPGAITVTVT